MRLSILLTLFAWCHPAIGREAMYSGTFDSAGVPIAYLVSGEGEPVVLIHGLHASARTNWQLPGTMALLAEHHRVVALDVRGHGQSGKPGGEKGYGVEMVEDVLRLMDHLRIDKAHIVGYSMGGMIAMKFMIAHPDRVLSGTLGGMGWMRAGGRLQVLWETLPGRGIRTPEALVRSIATLAVSEEAVRGIQLPVAVIVGDRDPVKRLYVAPLARIRDDWPIMEIAGAGHLSCIAKVQFQETLMRWIDKNAQ